MLFNMQSDTGDCVTGYLVPDTYSVVPTIRVSSGGKDVLVFSANEVREAIAAHGRHESGVCGFSIDTQLLPGLREMADLEIFDAETGLLIYRRPKATDIQRKILRLETHLFPLWQFDYCLEPLFQYFSKGIENLGRETVTQLLMLDQVNSVYLSGRILYRTYEFFLEAGFETILLLQNPYEELAERLLVLSNIKRLGGGHFGQRDNIELKATIDYAEALVAEDRLKKDDKQLRRALRNMPPEVVTTLASPVVRLLTNSTPEEMPRKGAVAGALDLLASAAVVGLRHESEFFLTAVGHLLRIDPEKFPKVPLFSLVSPFAERLKNTREVDALLEMDLELYHYIVEASAKNQLTLSP
jgi:hypothetical protein